MNVIKTILDYFPEIYLVLLGIILIMLRVPFVGHGFLGLTLIILISRGVLKLIDYIKNK
jgi:membrane-bound ClpP family serine protease